MLKKLKKTLWKLSPALLAAMSFAQEVDDGTMDGPNSFLLGVFLVLQIAIILVGVLMLIFAMIKEIDPATGLRNPSTLISKLIEIAFIVLIPTAIIQSLVWIFNASAAGMLIP